MDNVPMAGKIGGVALLPAAWSIAMWASGNGDKLSSVLGEMFVFTSTALVAWQWWDVSEQRRKAGRILKRFDSKEKLGFLTASVIALTGTPFYFCRWTGLTWVAAVLIYGLAVLVSYGVWTAWDEYQERTVQDCMDRNP